MHGSYPFPIYSGLMEPKHYKQIGSAIWLFLWCISATTKEVEKEGVMWGAALGNKPVKINDLADVFNVSRRTIISWLSSLEKYNYIHTTRTSYGIILSVKNSKKYKTRHAENCTSGRDEQNISHLDVQKTAHQGEENCTSNKDIIKDIINTTTTSSLKETDGKFESLLKTFCEIHGKLDIHVKAPDIVLMTELIALGVSLSLITRVMRQVHQERTARGAKITTFAYYKNAILEAWEADKAITGGVSISTGLPSPTVALGSAVSRKQSKTEFFKQKAREEMMRDKGRGLESV